MKECTTLANPNTSWRTQRYFYFMSKYKKEEKNKTKQNKKKTHIGNILVPSLAGQYPPGSLAEKQDDSTEIVFSPLLLFVITPAVLPGAISADPKTRQKKNKPIKQVTFSLIHSRD